MSAGLQPVGRRRDELNVLASLGGVHSTTVVFAVVAILFLSTLPAVLDAKPVCGPDQFYLRGQCSPCSTCPAYLIVLRLCMPNSDTLCGRLSDFEFLHVVNNGAGRRTRQPVAASSVSASPNSVVDIHSENSGTL